MTYYTSFDSDGFWNGSTNLRPEEIEGVEIFEIDDELGQKPLFKDENGNIREATQEELESRIIKLQEKNLPAEIRMKRDSLLYESDVLVMIDRWEQYTTEKKTSITNYRKALRDLPLQEGFPTNVFWPTIQE